LVVGTAAVLVSSIIGTPPLAAAAGATGSGTHRLAGQTVPSLGPALARGLLRPVHGDRPTKQLTLTLVLRRSDQGGFDRFVAAVQDRTSPLYRHFLTQTQLAARFGPSLGSYDAVLAWLRRAGFVVVQGSANRLTLTVHGTEAQAEHAFGVTIGNYVSRRGQSFYANLQDPVLPSAIAADVASVGGLSNLGAPQVPEYHALLYPFCLLYARSQFDSNTYTVVDGHTESSPNLAKQLEYLNKCFTEHGSYTQTALFRHGTVGTRSRTRVTPSTALGAGGHGVAQPQSVDGTGQRIGLVEFDNFHASDVSDYLTLSGSTASTSNLSEVDVNGGAGAPGPAEAEVLLDADIAMAVAPGAHVVVYDAPATTSFAAMFNAMVGDGDTVISNSWSSCEDQVSEAEADSIDSVLAQAAASGVSVLNGSGDSGSTCLDGSPNTIGVPSDSPNATAVGGTSLTLGPGPTYQGETWWDGSQSTPQTGQGGFGVSHDFTRPSYQQGHTASAARSVPDVAVNADPAQGYVICQADAGGCPTGLSYGGTSAATPLMAAMVATLNQQVGHSLGALNPAFYPLDGTPAFHSAASMASDFAHVGLGSPNMDQLGLALLGTTAGPVSAGSFVDDSAYGGIPANGTSMDHVVVFLRDSDGHSVSGKHVSLTANAGSSAVISAASGPSSTDGGTVTFDVTDLVAEHVVLTATDTDDGITIAPTVTANFTTPVATGAEIFGGPNTVPNDGTSTATVTVYLQNSLARPAAGKVVSLAQGGGHAVITPSGSSVPGTTAVTDSAGNATFTITDTSTESVDFTATDVTDGSLPVPGSVIVSFAPGGASCNTTLPTATNGYSATAFATGFPYTVETVVYPGNFTVSGCTAFESAPAFDAAGNAYVPDTADGTIHVLGPDGGTPSPVNQLPATNFPGGSLGQLAFGTDGSLYAGLIQSSGSVSNPEVVQLDPATGATLKVVASTSSGLPDCPFVLVADPLSGDLFVDDECSGFAASNQISRISDPSGAHPTVSNYVTTGGCNLGMSFAPDGTLYLANCNGEVDAIGGTNTVNPAVTKVANVPGAFSVAVVTSGVGGHATAIDAFSSSGNVSAIDLTTTPATVTTAATGTALLFLTANARDGCAYGTIAGTIVKVGPPACASTSTTEPEITLTPDGSTSPPIGSSAGFSVDLQNVPNPNGTPLRFDVVGPNPVGGLVDSDGSGHAQFDYQGVFRGVDTVTASAVVNGQTITSAPIRVHWNSGKDTTFLDLNASPQGGQTGQPTSLTATLLDASQSPPTTLSGRTVTLTLGGQMCTTATNGAGVAACDLTPQSPGLLATSATFAGDASYTPAQTTNSFIATLPNGNHTTTVVQCAPGSAAVGAATTCTATVTDTTTGSPTTPTGTVTFASDSAGMFSGPGNSCSLSGSGASASCAVDYTPTAAGTGTHLVTGRYGGDASHASSQGSGEVSVTVTATGGGGGGGRGGASTSTTLESSASLAVTGRHVTYTATVSPAPAGGTVRFTDGGAMIRGCRAVPVTTSTGTATCHTSYGRPGSHLIQAAYSGDAGFGASSAATLTERILSSLMLVDPPTGVAGKVGLLLSCAARSHGCATTISLVVGGSATQQVSRRAARREAGSRPHRVQVGHRMVHIQAGKSKLVHIRLNRAGQRRLAAAGRLRVRYRVRLTVLGASSTAAAGKVVVHQQPHTRGHLHRR
jgi:kumamolisin